MEELKSNSHKSREVRTSLEQQHLPDKRVEKVIKGTAQVRKKSGISKFADAFIQEDIANVKAYIWADVLIPTLKKAVSEIVSNGVDMFLYGESRGAKRPSNGVSRISYRKFYEDDRRADRDRNYRARLSEPYAFDDLTFDTKQDAEEVILAMEELISVYGQASIADLYDLVNMVGNSTDNRYGWTNLGNASSVRLRDGRYLLKLPRAVPLQTG